MKYRHIGHSGLRVSEISLGGWTTFGSSIKDEAEVRSIIATAYESGVNFFDIADAYGRGEAERVMGRILADFPRHTLVISSKLYWPQSEDPNDRGLSRKHIMESIEKSLKRIGTDYIDMYFCHRYDEETPLEETVRAMDDLIHQGKVLYWGTSEWSADQMGQVHAIAEKHNLYKPTVNQPEYSLLARRRFEREILPKAQALGMGLVTFSPLASGLLTGKYDEGIPESARLGRIESLRNSWVREDRIEQVKAFKSIADDLGISRAQLALAWILRHPALSSVITGATSSDQVNSNLKAGEISLTDDVLSKLDAIFTGETEDQNAGA